MTRNETIVYKAVQQIVSRRKAAHRVPECALLREIQSEVIGNGIGRHELTRILMGLVRSGDLRYSPTINDQSYYLTTDKEVLSYGY